jgi:hypothetical protein
MSNTLLDISALVFGVFFLAFLVSISLIIKENLKRQSLKKKVLSANSYPPILMQSDSLLQSDSFSEFHNLPELMSLSTKLTNKGNVSTTTQTTIQYEVEVL